MPSSSALFASSMTSWTSWVSLHWKPCRYSTLRLALVAFSTKDLRQSLRPRLGGERTGGASSSGALVGEKTGETSGVGASRPSAASEGGSEKGLVEGEEGAPLAVLPWEVLPCEPEGVLLRKRRRPGNAFCAPLASSEPSATALARSASRSPSARRRSSRTALPSCSSSRLSTPSAKTASADRTSSRTSARVRGAERPSLASRPDDIAHTLARIYNPLSALPKTFVNT
mmetsp:Transcript_106815/g.312231  ORF Transcript_106815/g.312231 Transcript_106815/m.312231 type:complete len:228 (+) Transcript_106815:796-1479(+)